MRTRQKPRRNINIPGRYFTGLGSPVDIVLLDISEGGCRFPSGSLKLAIGSPIQIYVAGSGPHRASVRWLEQGEVGVTFASPLAADLVEQFKGSHIPDLHVDEQPGDFDPMPDARPQRFC